MSRIWSGIRKKLENVPTESLPQAFILESREQMRRFTTAIPM